MDVSHKPLTYRTLGKAPVRSAPRGSLVKFLEDDTRFTSAERRNHWIKVTGHFPDNQWQPLEKPVWINSYYVDRFYPQLPPKKSKRPKGASRLVAIDKSDFLLKIIEINGENKKTIYQTKVGLGRDGCMPKEKGGRCYYTQPGEYQVRWKIEDERGIEWCIPKSMEKEYQHDINAGNRCFRGPLGTHALNIGGSYAIHGTNSPGSIGKKRSHGCIRAKNRDIRKIYAMIDIGDKVIITD